MTSAVINCNITTLDADDRRAAKKAIADYNASRQSVADYLPMSTVAEVKSSYETLLMDAANKRHAAMVTLATEQSAAANAAIQALKGPMGDATPAKQAAALAAALAALA